MERQNELGLNNMECEKEKKKKRSDESGGESSSGVNLNDEIDPGEIVKTIRAFMSKFSSDERDEVLGNVRFAFP